MQNSGLLSVVDDESVGTPLARLLSLWITFFLINLGYTCTYLYPISDQPLLLWCTLCMDLILLMQAILLRHSPGTAVWCITTNGTGVARFTIEMGGFAPHSARDTKGNGYAAKKENIDSYFFFFISLLVRFFFFEFWTTSFKPKYRQLTSLKEH